MICLNIHFKLKKRKSNIKLTSNASFVLGCVSPSLKTYDMSGPLGNGPGSQEMATRLGSGAAALRLDGAELGFPLSSVDMTTEGVEYTGSPEPL